jgi:cyclophilin family peptidyl-prolyl cis-trans isomerase
MHRLNKSLSTLASIVLISIAIIMPCSAQEQKPLVVFETTLGDITIETWPEKAPITVKNFLQYVNDGFYNGTIFHRVIPQFVVQGGGFALQMERKETRPPIKNESINKERNLRSTLSMARTNDPHSASSQFFINLQNNYSLDYRGGRHGYAVFAAVIDGMNVVDSMAAKPTGRVGPYSDVPVEPIIITKAYVKQAPKKAEVEAAPAAPQALKGDS